RLRSRLGIGLGATGDKKKGKIVLVNRMDNEHADYDKTLEGIHENTGINPSQDPHPHRQRRLL
ncbi:MAG: hypothetical protein LRZ88_09225, partial [Candidatus Cloacimonetes bacterium]|nr:hypothetical protein [Candidatus Cloacimonadota bacterium]